MARRSLRGLGSRDVVGEWRRVVAAVCDGVVALCGVRRACQADVWSHRTWCRRGWHNLWGGRLAARLWRRRGRGRPRKRGWRGHGAGQRVGLAKSGNIPFQDRGAVLAQQKCEQPLLYCCRKIMALLWHSDGAQHSTQRFGAGGTGGRPRNKSLEWGRLVEVVTTCLCDEGDGSDCVVHREKRAC